MRPALALVVAATLGLGAGGCYLAHEREASCAASGPAAPCVRWEAAGPSALIAGPTPIDEARQLTSIVPSGCGLVVAWYRLSGSPFPDTLSFETREIDWSGAPSGDVHAHPALTVTSTGSGNMELAERGGALAAIVSTSPGGCRFVPLDASGADRGAPVTVSVPFCTALQLTDEGYSLLASAADGRTPGVLVRMDPAGAAIAMTTLDVPPGRVQWSRARRDDGSFILYTFSEDPITIVYSGWLQQFDARGVALAPEVELGVNAVPVQLAPTPGGAVAAWETATSGGLPLQTRAIHADARPAGPIRDLPARGAQYGLVLTSTPDGGALAMWLEDHFDEPPDWRLLVQALGPDAAPRGEPSRVLEGVNASGMRVLVEGSGERALVVYDDGGPRALPLRCAGP